LRVFSEKRRRASRLVIAAVLVLGLATVFRTPPGSVFGLCEINAWNSGFSYLTGNARHEANRLLLRGVWRFPSRRLQTRSL
jgi:hypothetical protein